MKIRTMFVLLLLVLVGAFSALNWSVFTAPTTLSLGLVDIQAPLGLVLLGLLVFVTLVFLVFVLYLQTVVFVELRRHAREMREQRQLAEQAEASRLTELREFMALEFRKQASAQADAWIAMTARMDQLDHGLRAALEQSNNATAAYIGELEDRLERWTSGQTPQAPV